MTTPEPQYRDNTSVADPARTATGPAGHPDDAARSGAIADQQYANPQHTDQQYADPARHADTTQAADTGHIAAEYSEQHADGESLFHGVDMSGLRSRWDEVQAAFVDDPRECVQKADRLVSDVVEQLTTGFTQARERLEEQWSRGQEASTEDLRQALKRYREFFQRLLTVN